MDALIEMPQKTLFNIDTTDITPTWLDPTEPLHVPIDPIHFEAHELQQLLARLKHQSLNNPAQFNSKNYIAALSRFSELCDTINNPGKVKEAKNADDNGAAADNDTRDMGNDGHTAAARGVGVVDASSMGNGVPADYPFARQRSNTV